MPGTARVGRSTITRGSSKQGHISVLYTKARSLIPKRDEFTAYIAVEKPDIVAISETWASSQHLISELTIPGYESFHKNRTHNKGGGVICYVKYTLSALKIDKQEAEAYDSILVEVATKNNKKFSFATVYRPLKTKAADDIVLYQEIHTAAQNNNVIIVGDFDCPNVDWSLMAGDQKGSRIIDMAEDSFLTQVITQPTRENNILVLVLVSDPDLIRNCQVGEKLNGCDHHLIRFNICIEHELTENKAMVPDYRKADFNRARELLQSIIVLCCWIVLL